MFIPEIKLLNVIHILLAQGRERYKSDNSYFDKLFSLDDFKLQDLKFNDRLNSFGKLNFKEQLVSLFSSDNEISQIQVTFGLNFEHKSNKVSIHISMPLEQYGSQNSVGYSHGFNEETESFANTVSFNTTYLIVLVCQNLSMCIAFYHYLKSLIVSNYSMFELLGFNNVKITGQDISLEDKVIPVNVFTRSISLNFDYLFSSEDFQSDALYIGSVDYNVNFVNPEK